MTVNLYKVCMRTLCHVGLLGNFQLLNSSIVCRFVTTLKRVTWTYMNLKATQSLTVDRIGKTIKIMCLTPTNFLEVNYKY